jgi:hypothetical protein
MATSKKPKIDGYFFMSITDGEMDIDCAGDDMSLAAAFATLITDDSEDNKQLRRILGAAIEFAIPMLQKTVKPTKDIKKK